MTPEQEELRRKGLELLAKIDAWEATHPEEARAKWERIERELAEHAVCDHDWQPDGSDPRYVRCTRCGWEAFTPSAADPAKLTGRSEGARRG